MGKDVDPAPTPAADTQARLATQLINESAPLRRRLQRDSFNFLASDQDVSRLPAFGVGKSILEAQSARARDATIANTPTGGGLTQALAELERGRARDLSTLGAGLAQDEVNRALTLGTGLVPAGLSGLSGASLVQAQAAQTAANQSSAKAGASGRAIGSTAASVALKNPAPAASAGGK